MPFCYLGMIIQVDLEELKKIEQKYGQLKKIDKSKVKWLSSPKWNEKTFDAVLVEVSDNVAPEIFEKFKVKAIRKK